MKKVVFLFLIAFIVLFSAWSENNFYFSIGPSVGATGQSFGNASTVFKTAGAQVRMGAFFNSDYTIYLSANVQLADPMNNISQFASLPSSLVGTLAVGGGLNFKAFNLFVDCGFRAFNIGLQKANIYLLNHFCVIPEFLLARKNSHSLYASLPFAMGRSESGSFFSTGLIMNYEYGVKK